DGDGLPMTLLCAEQESQLAHGLKRLQPGTFPMLRLYRGGFPVVQVELNSLGRARRERWTNCKPWHNQPTGVVERFRFHHAGWRIDWVGDLEREELKAYADAVDRTWQTLGTWSGLQRPKSPKLFAQDTAYNWRYSDAPEAWAQVDVESGSVQALLLPGHAGDGGAEAGRAFLEDHLGPAGLPWLAEALGVQASGVYWGRPLAEVWVHLARLHDLPSLQALITGRGVERVSPHLITPLRALLVQVVADQNPEQLLRLWTEGLTPADWKPWWGMFAERLGTYAAEPRPQRASDPLADWPARLGAALQG
ncbi:MAG: hypothetical protein KDB61_15935, partial [Planctomycetes bacterium]|nr:hypothetical protein [Planctomycetota bacterium]